jgi:3-phosphoshikimate 1-carboxyvinyltransferase
MPLPAIIEVVPLTAPVNAEITVPGSKSITNRALILAALATGATTLRGALWSEDTQVMTEALEKLGFEIKVENDPAELCNRTITIRGRGGGIPNAGSAEQPLEVFVGNAGTAARFLSALVCLGQGVYRLSGVPRMHERPQAPLFAALRELGYRVDSPNDRLPAVLHGTAEPGTRSAEPQKCRVSIAESSQFASALMLCARSGGWEVEVVGENAEESPYVAMTLKLIEAFPKTGGTFQIEPDASSGSYFWAAGDFEFSDWTFDEDVGEQVKYCIPKVWVRSWPGSNWQVDSKFHSWLGDFAMNSVWSGIYSPKFMEEHFGPDWREKADRLEGEGYSRIAVSRQADMGDSIMMAIVLAPFAILPATFTDLGRLRVQECERVVALRTELTRCGATVVEEGDTLTVSPSPLHGAEIETYHDHRLAMCFAILGLKVRGMRIKNPACVKKTFPNFFQKLAAPPPAGLGAEIRDGCTGRRLGGEELFAE